MRRAFRNCGLLVTAAALSIGIGCNSTPQEGQKQAAAPAAAAATAACTLPTTMAGSNEQTAWQIFVAANCLQNGQLTWETWTEQCTLQPQIQGCQTAPALTATNGSQHHFHSSELMLHLRGKGAKLGAAAGTPGGCNAMTYPGSPQYDPKLKPFVPANVSAKSTFCEEVFADPSEASFATSGGLITLTGQVAYAQAHSGTITFPTSAVEVKADWVSQASLNNGFNCPTDGLYTETIGGTCYALVGIHMNSKLLPNWLWATFEPQNTVTNPNRCKADLYNDCNDPWGSNPAKSTGDNTALTPQLLALMTAANLPKALQNYRLVVAQSDYVTQNSPTTPLEVPVQSGNSFVEFNAGVLPHQASCMTCHSYAQVTTTAQQVFFFGPPHIGKPGPIPPPTKGATFVSEDFSWMLGIMPAGGSSTTK